MLRNKVPAVTALFWVTKLLTTAMGETTSDYLVKNYDPVVAVIAAFVVFAAALALQFAVRRYIPWVYWLTVLMVAVFGTMVADVLHIVIGVQYYVSTVFFAIVLAAVFLVWYRSQRTLSVHHIDTRAREFTLSVHHIDTRAREFFYWCAVLATFALGTAVGDLTATTFGLGYLASGILFGVLFAIPGAAYRWWGMGATAAFWTSYVLTRPFGASISDWLAVSHARGGLDLGPGPVSLVLFAAIVVCVIVMTARRPADPADPARASAPEASPAA